MKSNRDAPVVRYFGDANIWVSKRTYADEIPASHKRIRGIV